MRREINARQNPSLIGRLRRFALVAPFLLATAPYPFCPVYDFPPPKVHAGKTIFNPYASVRPAAEPREPFEPFEPFQSFERASGERWLKVNLHAHARAYCGLTHGKSSPEEVGARYRALGYDLAALSTYHRIDTLPQYRARFLSAYEHGYNIGKTHQICVGASSVDYRDYPLWQSIHQRQETLQRLRADSGAVIILAHPAWGDGYAAESLARLTDYDAIEVFNHFSESLAHLDSAWSAGRTPWAVGADDSHDAATSGENGVCWTMAYAAAGDPQSVLRAIRQGRCYAVKLNSVLHQRWETLAPQRAAGECPNAQHFCAPERIWVEGDSVSFALAAPAKYVRCIGQNGALRAVLANVQSGGYRFRPDDTYIRFEIIDDCAVLALNPLARTDALANASADALAAKENCALTALWRAAWTLGYCALGAFVVFGTPTRRTRARGAGEMKTR
jgi:hypothetical protein